MLAMSNFILQHFNKSHICTLWTKKTFHWNLTWGPIMSKPLTVNIIRVESYLSPWKYSAPVLDSHISPVMLRHQSYQQYHLSVFILPLSYLESVTNLKCYTVGVVVHHHIMQKAAIRFVFYRSFWWASCNFWSGWKSGKMTIRFNITKQQQKS